MKYIFKTIYPVLIILYIFIAFKTGTGNTFEEMSEKKTVLENRYVQTELNVGYLSVEKDVLGLVSKYNFKEDLKSIHQYDDAKHKNDVVVSKPSTDTKNIAQDNLATYIYHSNPYNSKEIMGFVPYWTLNQYQQINYSRLSTIAYFSLTSDDTGAWIKGYLADTDGDGDKEWSPDGGYTGFNSSNFTNMVSLAHAKETKVILVAKNFDPYSIRQIVLNRDSAGDRLINNIVSTIASKNLDGVNVDFEYVPKLDRDTVTNELRQAFADWHTKLADRVHSEFPNAHVSTDVFGSSGVSYTMYDMNALGKSSIDYILMMTYDYITTSCWDGKKIAPMSPLYGNNLYGTPNWNTSSHLTAGASKAGSKKVLMGIPYYGIDFQVKSTDYNLYNARVDYPNCKAGIETYASIVDPSEDAYHNSSTIKWNDTEKARWYAYKVGGVWRHGYYDDASSLSAKYSFVNSANLGGIGIWVIGYDYNAKELYDVIRDKFQKIPYYVTFKYGISQERISEILSSNSVTILTDLGNGSYKVDPGNNVSADQIKKLRMYNEVVDASFDIDAKERQINLDN